MKRLIALLLCVGCSLPAWSEEGMWTLDNPPIKAMQRDIGWAPGAPWLEKTMRSAARIAGEPAAGGFGGRTEQQAPAGEGRRHAAGRSRQSRM